jgi:hypothetical protein
MNDPVLISLIKGDLYHGIVPEVSGGAVDWRSVMESAQREGVFYPFYRSLTVLDKEKKFIPQEFRQRLEQIYYLHISKSAPLSSQVEQVLERIESRNIPVLLFKGAAIDAFIYDGYLRQRLDLDIAVKDEDIAELEKTLADLGYTYVHNDKDYPLPEYLNSRLFKTGTDSLIPVHVHRHLINNMFLTVDNAWAIDMADVWSQAEPFKEYRNIFTFKPELNIIYLCEHGLKHDFDQLIFLFEIDRLIRYYRERLDWKKLVALAQRLGLARPVYHGLYLVREVLSAGISGEVLEQLKPGKLTTGEKGFIENTLKKRHCRYASFPVYLAMRAGLFKKANFIFRTLFPPGFSMRGYLRRMSRLILP